MLHHLSSNNTTNKGYNRKSQNITLLSLLVVKKNQTKTKQTKNKNKKQKTKTKQKQKPPKTLCFTPIASILHFCQK